MRGRVKKKKDTHFFTLDQELGDSADRYRFLLNPNTDYLPTQVVHLERVIKVSNENETPRTMFPKKYIYIHNKVTLPDFRIFRIGENRHLFARYVSM